MNNLVCVLQRRSPHTKWNFPKNSRPTSTSVIVWFVFDASNILDQIWWCWTLPVCSCSTQVASVTALTRLNPGPLLPLPSPSHPLPLPAPQVLLWSLRSSHFDPPHPPTFILQTPKWPSRALQNIWSPILLWNKWRWWDGVGWYKSYSRRCCLRLNASSSDATAMASATPVTRMSWLEGVLVGGRGNDLS